MLAHTHRVAEAAPRLNMKTLANLSLVLAVLCASVGAHASPLRMYQESRGLVLDDVALNAAAATRTTSSIRTYGFSTLTLGAAFTFDAATTLDIAYCEGTLDTDLSDPTWYRIAVLSSTASTGEVTSLSAGWTATEDGTNLAANYNHSFTVGITGHHYVRCVFAGGGTPTASDKLSVRAIVSVL